MTHKATLKQQENTALTGLNRIIFRHSHQPTTKSTTRQSLLIQELGYVPQAVLAHKLESPGVSTHEER